MELARNSINNIPIILYDTHENKVINNTFQVELVYQDVTCFNINCDSCPLVQECSNEEDFKMFLLYKYFPDLLITNPEYFI